MSEQKKRVCLVIGAGDATGSAIAKRFAAEGYVAVPVRRHIEHLDNLTKEIRDARNEVVPIGCDARQEDQMIALFDRIENEIGEPGKTVKGPATVSRKWLDSRTNLGQPGRPQSQTDARNV